MRLIYSLLLSTLYSLFSLQNVQAQSDFSVFEASINEIQAALEAGDTTSVDLVTQYLARIDAYDQQGPALNSIIRNNPEALALAAQLDRERQAGNVRSRLHGVPFVVKDNYNTDTMPTSGGSVALANNQPTSNATQVEKLIAAGGIIIAKTNLHEYAYGITTIGSLLGQTKNPYDIRRVPGGSSGGTGASVAASFAAFGLGSDTCGSIRIPSAYNNLIGLRPSKGLSSIYGVMPLSHTQDVAGPLARSVEDLAIILDVVKGSDPLDADTAVAATAQLPQFDDQLRGLDMSGLRIGRLSADMENADGNTRRLIDAALDWYADQGAEIVEVDIAGVAALISRSGVIGHEFRRDLNEYLASFASQDITSLADIVDQGLYHQAVNGVLTRSRGAEFDQQAYQRALNTRIQLRALVERTFSDLDLDALAYPPIFQTQVLIGDPQPGNNCSLSANSGLPALSMPVGFTPNGLPVGMELLGRFFEDGQLLAIAYPFEKAMATRQAPTSTPPLVAGEAPEALVSTMAFAQAGVAMTLEFEFDVLRNSLSYRVQLAEDNAVPISAVTLVINEIDAPVQVNLMGPARSSNSGSYFMSPQFRGAFENGQVYLKVFGASLPTSGISQRLP